MTMIFKESFLMAFLLISLMARRTQPVKVRQVKSSHQRCSIKKGVLRNFAKFTGKRLCQSLFFNKVAVAGKMNFSRTPEHNINFLTTDDLKVLNISFIIGVSLLAVNLSIALINANAFM